MKIGKRVYTIGTYEQDFSIYCIQTETCISTDLQDYIYETIINRIIDIYAMTDAFYENR